MQFEHLRQACLKARARAGERQGQKLSASWSMMPTTSAGRRPEFLGRVVKTGKTVYVVVVGLPKYATPIFSPTCAQ